MASLEKRTHFLQMPGDKTLVALNEPHFRGVILGDDNLSSGFYRLHCAGDSARNAT